MIAQYPPMGWNSWDCYGASADEKILRQNAEYMAAHMKEFGWEYLVLDIHWSQPEKHAHDYAPFPTLCMDEYGRLIPAENNFPSAAGGAGFKPLADYLHSLGLKLGLHIMRGVPREAALRHLPIEGSTYTCADAADPSNVCVWNPDMYGLFCDRPAAKAYYDSIFRLYASWGIDYIKCDDIAREYPHYRREVELVSDACRNCGRDIVLSLSPGPAKLETAEHLKTHCNLWRITDDFWDNWPALKRMFERAEKWCVHAGPGHWPDADMLPVGAVRQCNGPDEWTYFTEAEQRTMMSLWCILRSPLMMGGELTKNDDFTLSLLTNAGVLAMEKESFCAHPLRTTDEESVWIAPRMDGKGLYAAFFNLSDEPRVVTEDTSLYTDKTRAAELWTGASSVLSGPLSVELAPHDAAVFLIS